MVSRRVLFTAGSNAKGQLGIGSCDDAHTFTPCQFAGYEPDQLPHHTASVTHVACGANHTVLLLEHRDSTTALWGVGDGRSGQLGPSAPATNQVFRRLDLRLPDGYTYRLVAAAWETTYVVLLCPGRSDVLLSMGSNEFGALGVGAGEGTSTRAEISSGSSSGTPRVVDFDHIFLEGDTRPQRIHIQSLHAGPRHVVAQLLMTRSDTDGSHTHSWTVLVGWGASRHGQLGPHAGARCLSRPTRLPIDVDADPMVSCALGNQHTVVLHASGRISTLGSNKRGQIPSFDGSQAHPHVCELGCTWNGTYMHTIDGDTHVMLSTGNGAQGQLGRSADALPMVDRIVGLPVDRTTSSLVCGSEHVLVTMSRSSGEELSIFGWGWNEHGNMGLGSLDNVTVPTQLWPREEYKRYPQRVIGVWAGCATSWLLVE